MKSLIKKRENVKLEYQKLFDSIERTRTQTQGEIDELIENVNQKTLAYADVRAHNQDLFITIYELKAKLKNVEKGLKDATSVRRLLSRASSSKNSVLSHTKSRSTDVEVHVKSNKKTNILSKKNVVQNKKNVTNVDVKNAPKANDVLCVSCAKNVLIPCHDSCLAKYKLNMHSNVKRVLFTTPRTATPVSLDTTSIVTKTSGCSKHMTGDLSLLKIFVEKFIGTVPFGNDHFTAITGYCNYIHGNITICYVYYVEGLGHNLFSVGQFYEGDFEVAFRSKTCYVQNLEGDDLLIGARESNLYTISISDMADSSLVCLMSKATSTKSWLWHRRLSHLNFGTINDLTKQDLIDGFPKFKYDKDHLCSACERGKSQKASHLPKFVPCTHSKLELIHMDLCGPMRVESINVQTGNATRRAHYENLCIMQQFSIARTPQQNGVVERRNYTIVEAACIMLIFSKSPAFLWAEAYSTACFTQNCSLIHTRYNKTLHEILRGRKPNIGYFYVFGSLCYLTNDKEDLGKMKPKADIGIFIGYSESSKGFWIYNRRTRKIMETIHVKFDELTAMASEHHNNEAPPLVSSSEEHFFPNSNDKANELSQEDKSADFNRNTLLSPYHTPMFEEAGLSLTAEEPSEMQVITPVQPSTHVWTKAHPLDQVIGDPSRPVMTRSKLSTDSEVCMYALTVSTIEPKNIKEAMSDHSWIESMQDELHQF
ncbi:retrovirus-related pol polyprotein from transposon TNT 1-94 [Tanacetum coccineum]